MTHAHQDFHDVVIIERDESPGLTVGLVAAIVIGMLLSVVLLSILFARPWA